MEGGVPARSMQRNAGWMTRGGRDGFDDPGIGIVGRRQETERSGLLRVSGLVLVAFLLSFWLSHRRRDYDYDVFMWDWLGWCWWCVLCSALNCPLLLR